MKCQVCKNESGNTTIKTREQLLGLGGEFSYNHCAKCRALELINIPDNLAPYYPHDLYYSFKNNINPDEKISSFKNIIRRTKALSYIFGKNKILGELLSIGYKKPGYFHWLKKAGIGLNDSILDIGCGNGELLFVLRKTGFKQLTGIDPFITSDYIGKEVSLHKKSIFDIKEQYDFVMSHHSFEHMADPQSHLIQLGKLLKKEGTLLIRTPVTNAYCLEKYGSYWAALDPPRHIHIQSHESMDILCEQAGLKVIDLWHDAQAFQFWGSEEYLKGINSTSEKSCWRNKKNSSFSKNELKEFKKRIAKLNEQKLGGEACFMIKKK